MDRFVGWVVIIALGFAAVMTPILMIAIPVAGVKITLALYVFAFIELACILIFICYKVFRKKTKPGELKNKMIPTSFVACVVAVVLGIALSPLYEFEGSKKSSYSSYRSTSSWSYRSSASRNSSAGNGNSGGSSRTTTSRATARPASYSGNTSRSTATTRPQRTVNPDDHDIESYYLDYQDEFEDEDDAWDDFEDDPDVWDDY